MGATSTESDLAVAGRLHYDPAAMSCFQRTLIALVLITLGRPAINLADETRLLPQNGVLVLRNERVLRGNILQVGDRYVVGLNARDEVSVPIDRVEMRCDSLEEAYQRKRGQLPRNAKAADHLRLADWCLRYELNAAAAEQLMAAQSREPLNPANARFEKRLRLAVAQRPEGPSRSVVSSPPVSSEELETMVKSLPQGTVEQFTNTIQPLLINRCGGGGCHATNADAEFQLIYPHGERTLPRRFTQQNLKHALDMLDGDEPAKSPLLVMATRAHGGASKPSLTEEDVSQLQQLADWVFKSLNRRDASPPAVVRSPDPLLLQPIDQRTTNTPVHPLARPAEAAAGAGRGAIATGDRVVPASHQQPIRDADESTPVPGVDPFDPAIFNRRYWKRQ